MKLIENKTAIITGGSRGIGKGIALKFAEQGCNVAFTFSSSEAAAKKIETELLEKGVKAKAYQSNAAIFSDAETLVQKVLEDFSSIDIVINNAGITRDNLLMRMKETDFDKVIEINLKSVFNMTKAVQPIFLRQRKGGLIHMSSVVALRGNAGQCNYAASKAGIIGFSNSIALELASRNIRSNVIAPGFITTEMTEKIPEVHLNKWIGEIPLKRAGTTEDIANACVFLASDMASYITGQVLNVNGGLYI